MRQMYKTVFLLLLSILSVANAQGKMYGLFYGDDTNNCLGAENDVTRLADLYRNNGGQVILIKGDAISPDNILKHLKIQCDACTEDDIIIFAFSGHGNKGFLSCGKKTLNFDSIINELNACKANRKVIILDACYSGSFIEKWNRFNGKNTVIITSSRSNEESYSFGENGGIFFSNLIDGLNGNAHTNSDGKVVLRKCLTTLAKKQNMCNIRQ